MKDPDVAPWDTLPEEMKQYYVKKLIGKWPTMKRQDREFAMRHRPHQVKAAGLWPEGGVLPPRKNPRVKVSLEEHIAAIAKQRNWKKGDWKPWGGLDEPWEPLKESDRDMAVETLEEIWDDLSVKDREFIMFQEPDVVKAADLWSAEELESD